MSDFAVRVGRPLVAAALGAPLLAACGASAPFHPATPADSAAGSPLGPSYMLVPLPNDDDSLLGRVLLDVPQNGRSLDEVSRPNECGDKLTPKKEGPLASTFEDAQELAAGGKARAALGAFGFEGDAQTATHFYYKLEVSKRASQTDTTEYTACCKEKGSCGYGFISALIYGDGQYATATESSAEANVSIPIAGGGGGFVRAKILHKRNVRGFVAAVVTVTDPAKSKAVSVIGDPAAIGITLTEQTLPDQVKARFEAQKIQIVAHPAWKPVEFAYTFRDGSGDINERTFVDRYAELTGAHDLDGAPAASGTPLIIGGSVLAGLGFVTLIVEVAAHAGSAGCSGCGNGTPDTPYSGLDTAVAIAGGAGTLLGIIGLTGGLTMVGNDSVVTHRITRFDAELYAARYNRALLRKTIQDTQTRMRELSASGAPPMRIVPVVSPGFLGVTGTF